MGVANVAQLTNGIGEEDKKCEAVTNYLNVMSQFPAIAMRLRESFLISCWHSSADESAAMWKSYGKHDGGVAVTIALKARPGKITDQELEREKGGSGLRYSFNVKSQGVTYEVGVDAKTGAVLENGRDTHPD